MAAAAPAADPIADTSTGRFRGLRKEQCYAFLGMRYAVAERFLPPRPAPAAAGITEAAGFGATAPQTNPTPSGPPPIILAHLPRPPGAPPPARPPESEDCLFLNVWTSGLADGRKRPVMIWLHGGFFSSGSGASVDGSALAARGDVVIVSVNHRVNAFGFTPLGALGGAEFAQSSNAGMLDIIAAIEWVRTNIAAFGGDPGRITMFGTSGGGMKTGFLMASPQASKLFHRAAVQSGPALRFPTVDQASIAAERLLHELGLTSRTWAMMRTMPMTELLGAYHRVAAAMPPRSFTDLPCFAPTHDPELLPRDPFTPDAAPSTVALPLLIGSNDHEMTFFMGNDMAGFALDEAGLHDRVERIAGGHSAEVIDAYRDIYPEASPSRRWVQFFTDVSILVPTITQARRHEQAGGKTWRYRVELESTAMDGKLGATHTIETPLIFDSVEGSRALLGPGEAPVPLAKAMSSAWASYAATGEAPWPASSRDAMLFGPRVGIETNADSAKYDLLSRVMGG